VPSNNETYGLAKGQYSHTSRRGTKSPSTPQGSVDYPVSAGAFALGAGARFVARSVDTLQAHLVGVLKRARAHRGASFVEVFQNCVVFNDGAFDAFTAKDVAADTQIHVEHGKPLLFGAGKNRGLRLKPRKLELEVVTVGEGGITADDVLVHDETNRALAPSGISGPRCGRSRGQAARWVWNGRAPCRVSTRQCRISTSSSIAVTRVISKTNPAATSASSRMRREAESSSAGSRTSANSSSSSSRSDTKRAGSDHGKQRRTHTARSAPSRTAHSRPSARRSRVRAPAGTGASSTPYFLTTVVVIDLPQCRGVPRRH